MNINDIQTPCYILHESILMEGIEKLKKALQNYWPNAICGYSVKTNGLPWLVNHMKSQGFFGEVVSEDEYYLVRKLGFDKEKIIFNGPVKGKVAFLEAIKTGAIVNIDSKREVQWLIENKEDISPSTRIGIRANFNIEEECPGEGSGGNDGSRFGFSYENGDWKQAFDTLCQNGIHPSGIHIHVGSHTRSVSIYQAIARQMCRMKEEYGLEIGFLDIGGGYFGGMPNRPEYKDYVSAVADILSKTFDPTKTTLIMEPGTSLCSAPFDYKTTVVDVKDTYASRIVTIDGSRSDIDPLHTKSGYLMDMPVSETTHPRQLVYGYTCMEGDRLMTLEDKPELCVGDVITMHKVGGYTMCLTPLFIKYFPRVYLERQGELSIIRDKWTEEEYINKSRL